MGRRRGLREDARAARLRPHRPARRAARAGLRHARGGLRPVRLRRSASASWASSRPTTSDQLYAESDFISDPPAQDARDARLARRRGAGQVPRRRADRQLRARRAGRRRGAQGRARLRQGRRRRARRVHARSRSPTTRCSAIPTWSSRRTWPPRRPRRRTAPACRPPSRSSPRSPAASSRPRSTSPRSAPRTWRCSARSCRWPAASAGWRWRSPSPRSVDRDRARVPGPDRRARHAPAHPLGPQRPAGRPHRRGGQPRQRAVAGRAARASRSPSASEQIARDFTDLVRVTVVARRRAHARGGHDAGPPAPPAPAGGVGPALQPADGRGPPGAVPLPGRAGHDRARRAPCSASTA